MIDPAFVPASPEDLKRCLSDPMWRICSGYLYKIMIKGDDEDPDTSETLVISFIPNVHQMDLLNDLYNRNIILKARQLGFTTVIAIYFLDCALFRENVRAGIIAQNDEIAKNLFRDKVQFAYKNLPSAILKTMPLLRDSQSELLLAHNNSSIRVATSMRSGTLQYLHVSEFGKICSKYPERAEEVVTGSIPAVPTNGVIFIESTAEGQDGAFYKMSTRSEKLRLEGKKLGKKDYRFHFYPWWIEETYAIDTKGVIITQNDHEYFDKVEAEAKCKLSLSQRAWWCSTRDSEFSGADENMWSQYPSTSKEAFQQSKEGCFYTTQMTTARKQGRIARLAYRPGYQVNTFWDIGHGDGTAIWFHQRVGQYDNFIKFIEGWGEPYSHYVKLIQETGWIWGRHYLPHDADHIRQGERESIAPVVMLKRLGLENLEIVPRVDDISHGIQITRDAFSTCWFDEVECKEGIKHLDSYKKAWSKTNGRFLDTPLHDIHSEGADAFRQFGQGYKGDRGMKNKPRPRPLTRKKTDKSVGY